MSISLGHAAQASVTVTYWRCALNMATKIRPTFGSRWDEIVPLTGLCGKSIPSSAPSTTTTTAATALRLRPGFVDGQSPSVDFFAVESGNGRLGLCVTAHLDEAKTFGSSSVSIDDDLGGC